MGLRFRKEFYFVRHGETDHNLKKIFAGSSVDVPLNDKGKQQAEILRPIIAKLPISAFYHSPLLRAKETMAIAAEGKGEVIEELKECYDKTWQKVLLLGEEEELTEAECFLNQVLIGVNKALETPGVPLLVSHGGVHRALCYHLQIEDHDWNLHNCGLVHFRPMEDFTWKAQLLH